MIELEPAALRRVVDPECLGLQSTAQLSPSADIVGQPRALAALRFGLHTRDHGFNIYVAGPPGVGKMATVQSVVTRELQGRAAPADWCYLYNFADPYWPRAYALPAGRGRQLQSDMRGLIEHVRRELPRAFERDEYISHREALIGELNRRREQALERLAVLAAEAGFAIRPMPVGIAMIPLRDGKPISNEEFQQLSPAERDTLNERREGLQHDLDALQKEIRAMELEAQEQIQRLDDEVALHVVRQRMDGLEERYGDLPEIGAFLAAARTDLLEHAGLLQASRAGPAEGAPDDGAERLRREQLLRRYEVNLLVDHGEGQGAPIIVERHPSYANLCGRIEREAMFGTLITDFTMLKAGALHRANGGFLILAADALLSSPLAWDGLKRALLNREIQIEDAGESLGFISTRNLRPQPIPLDVKVLLVGSPRAYYLLSTYDEQFAELFKLKAEFETSMPDSPENERRFLEVIAGCCAGEQLLPLDAAGCAKLIEQAAREAEHRGRLSIQFGALTDMVREASFLASRAGAAQISAAHIRAAREARVYRVGGAQARLQELIGDGTLIIPTAGRQVGQINGLAVLSTGDHLFGMPTRITASVGPGREGLLDIEREARLGGPIHSKGVMILGGYLAQTFAADQPLSLRARLVFEQSYEGVEGDSASSAELYALLSALAELPIRQGVAVTGALSQRGEVEAIGGVNLKVEGFFDVCGAAGLTGDQGVIIPRSNLSQLMLREDVVAAVAEGRFHIWAVGSADEGIALLTGVPAGERGPDGTFPPESVNGRVARRLQRFADCMARTADV